MRSYLWSLMLVSATISVYAQQSKVTVTSLTGAGDTLFWYIGAPAAFRVTVDPGYDSIQTTGRVISSDSSRSTFVISCDDPLQGILPVCARVWYRGTAVMDCCALVTFWPIMQGGFGRWSALKPEIGRMYNPTSTWMAREEQHANSTYQTVVEANGETVFEMTGTIFLDTELPESLRVFGMTTPLATKVYWRPYRTSNRSEWVLFASSTADAQAVVDIRDKRNW